MGRAFFSMTRKASAVDGQMWVIWNPVWRPPRTFSVNKDGFSEKVAKMFAGELTIVLQRYWASWCQRSSLSSQV